MSSFYESQIDPSHFGLIADYLVSRRSPINFLLHVRQEAELPKLAEELERAFTAGALHTSPLPELVERRLREGSLKVSSRAAVELPNADCKVEAASVRKDAPCKVLYLPPFYLVHTPGLFEGRLAAHTRPASAERPLAPWPESQAQALARQQESSERRR